MKDGGWTEEAVAAELRKRGCDVSRVAVHYWRTGKTVPRWKHAVVLAEALGTTLDALTEDRT